MCSIMDTPGGYTKNCIHGIYYRCSLPQLLIAYVESQHRLLFSTSIRMAIKGSMHHCSHPMASRDGFTTPVLDGWVTVVTHPHVFG